MPRGVHVTRVLPILTKRKGPIPKVTTHGPKLYNAKRPVQRSLGISSPQVLSELQSNPYSESWRGKVSKDVETFIDDMEAQGTKLLPEEQTALLRSPAHFFSRPQNVPATLREQVYFPKFTVTMRRQRIYGPYYAQFNVPLWFSKLDLKSYLKQAYNVDVVHIRSYTTPALVGRKTASNPYSLGELIRKKSHKRMLVQLVEPFEWPVDPKDVDKSLFDTTHYWNTTQTQNEEAKITSDINHNLINREHRKTIADQAAEILEGKAKWAPTWPSLTTQARTMKGIAEASRKESVLLPNVKVSEVMRRGRSIRVL